MRFIYRLLFFFSLLLWSSQLQFSFSPIILAQSVTVTANVEGTCGNGVYEYGEECDGSDLNSQTCASRGFSGGTLSCNANCTFNTSSCTTGGGSGGSSSGGGGGGGGGGSSLPPATSVSLSGRAHPKSGITVLKDGQVAASTVAGADAQFSVSISGISGGNYIFSIYGEDQTGNRSSLQTFPISVTQGASTQISGIFVAPTIAIDKSQVKRGDTIAIFGQSAPESQITVQVGSENESFQKTNADKNGAYLLNFDTSPLEEGGHVAKSKSALMNEISPFSSAVSFSVGKTSILLPKTRVSSKSDLNGDTRINLVDFSVMAYWHNRPAPPAKIDLNGDGKVNLVDFSILAFHWTG